MFIAFFFGAVVGLVGSLVLLALLIYTFLLKPSGQRTVTFDRATRTFTFVAQPVPHLPLEERLPAPTSPRKRTLSPVDSNEDLEHPAESCEWLNILIHRVYHEFITQPEKRNEEYRLLLQEKFDAVTLPIFLSRIQVVALELGHSLPRFEFASVRKLDADAARFPVLAGCGTRLLLDVRYSGGASITAATSLELMGFASLPVTLSFTLKAIDFQLVLVIPDNRNSLCTLALAAEPKLEFHVGSVIGYKNQLKDVPRIAEFIIQKLRDIIRDEIVLPNGFCFRLPLPGAEIDFASVRRRARPSALHPHLEHHRPALLKPQASVPSDIGSTVSATAGGAAAASSSSFASDTGGGGGGGASSTEPVARKRLFDTDVAAAAASAAPTSASASDAASTTTVSVTTTSTPGSDRPKSE